MSNYKIYPKCLNGNDPKPVYYSSLGYFLPCCWCDGDNIKEFSQFTNNDYHINNINSVEDVTNSNVFIDFYTTLKQSPEDAPSPCKRFCGKDKLTKEWTIT